MDKKGLSSTTIWFMIVTALFFDTIQDFLLPLGIGYFIPVVAYPTFWLWFKIHGISFFSMKRAPTIGIGALIELIPGLDALPALTATVARIALTSKAEAVVSETKGKVLPFKPRNQTDESTEDLSKAA